MQQEQRDYLVELWRLPPAEAAERLRTMLDHSNTAGRTEIREFMAGWYACVEHFWELKRDMEIAPEVDAVLKKLED